MYEQGKGVNVEQEGDRITTLEMDSSAFFASGSSVLSDEGQKILGELTEKLTSKDYINYSITVEGHTDDNPIHTAQFPSNWELSSARASAVVRFFIEHGIDPERLRAAGYADVFPKVPNRDSSGNPIPGNQAQNRRVVIKLEKITKSKKK
jgi:chemotaxis protein MotB